MRDAAADAPIRQQFVTRQIRENGISYNIYSEAKDSQRPWDLDLLPQMVDAVNGARWRPASPSARVC